MILQPVKSVPEKPAISAAPYISPGIIIMNFVGKKLNHQTFVLCLDCQSTYSSFPSEITILCAFTN
jgi:hypothetical protein